MTLIDFGVRCPDGCGYAPDACHCPLDGQEPLL